MFSIVLIFFFFWIKNLFMCSSDLMRSPKCSDEITTKFLKKKLISFKLRIKNSSKCYQLKKNEYLSQLCILQIIFTAILCLILIRPSLLDFIKNPKPPATRCELDLLVTVVDTWPLTKMLRLAVPNNGSNQTQHLPKADTSTSTTARDVVMVQPTPSS